MKFSATACVVLAAGATAQVLPGAFAPRTFSPYTFPRTVMPAAPAAAAPAAPAVSREELLAKLKDLATPEALAEAAAVKDDLVKTQKELAAAQVAAKKTSHKARQELFALQEALTDNVDKKEEYFDNYLLWEYKAKETAANKAYEAFVKKPSRATSLKAEAKDADAKGSLLEVWGHDDARIDQFDYQKKSALNTIAADDLHAAESALGVDGDAPAYFEALKAFERANEELWIQTFNLQGKFDAADVLSNKIDIENYEDAWAAYAKSKDPADIEEAVLESNQFILSQSDLENTNKMFAFQDYQFAEKASKAAQQKPQTIISGFVQRNPSLSSRFQQPAPPRPAFGGLAAFAGLGR